MAERELRRRGLDLLERNVRSAGGEIDLVAFDRKTLVFIEVKSRTASSSEIPSDGPVVPAFGEPEEAVDSAKIRVLVRAARAFAKRKGVFHLPRRYDTVAVRFHPEGDPDVSWREAAFDEGDLA